MLGYVPNQYFAAILAIALLTFGVKYLFLSKNQKMIG